MRLSWTLPAVTGRCFLASAGGAATVEFAMIAAAVLIAIAVAVGDIGTSLTAGTDTAAGTL